ncbi:MAG: (Fe-S)-binding protein [Spirochaetes bacterium]|nr:(Fe-S)-binding protein [Spirochaetota bacterium]
MQQTDYIIELAGHKKEDLSVCLGCRICASVCTVNDLEINANPQELLMNLFLGLNVDKDDPLVRFCTNCYRCTSACPWQIRIPDIVRGLRENLSTGSVFEHAIIESINIWGRMYEPYVFLRASLFVLKDGWARHMFRMMEYVINIVRSIHVPHKVKRI